MFAILAPLATGFGIGGGLIIAIGAQNALVLSYGLRQQHTVLVASVCVFIDTSLIVVGVSGMGLVLTQSPQLLSVARWGGAAFLLAYGIRAFIRATRHRTMDSNAATQSTWQAAVLATLAVSLLNPHVYLDTVLLVGSIGGQLPPDERIWFTVGAVLASCCWFFGLILLAGKLVPLFRKPSAWRVLDIVIGATMCAIAVALMVAR